MIKVQSKSLAVVVILLGVLSYVLYLCSTNEAKKYYEEFRADEIIMLEIHITNCYIAEKSLNIEVRNAEEINYFKNIFKQRLQYGSIKERKLYYYDVVLKFISNKNTYVYDIFVDNKFEPLRPVGLRKKKHNSWLSGYSFILNDPDYEFYNKILEMYNSK